MYFKGLEKDPLYEVDQYRPLPESAINRLPEDARDLLQAVMKRLADRVRIRRIQVYCYVLSSFVRG